MCSASLAEEGDVTSPTMYDVYVVTILRWARAQSMRRQLGPGRAHHLRSLRAHSGPLQGQTAASFSRRAISVSFGWGGRSGASCIVYRGARSAREEYAQADLSAEPGSGIQRRFQSRKRVTGSGHAELGVRVGFGSYTPPKTNRSPPIWGGFS